MVNEFWHEVSQDTEPNSVLNCTEQVQGKRPGHTATPFTNAALFTNYRTIFFYLDKYCFRVHTIINKYN